MPLFTSRRERLLWLWTLAVVGAIYATLGVAPSATAVLRSRGLLGATFTAGVILVAATVATLGLRTKPRGAEIGVALGIAAAYLLLFVRISLPEERTHLVEYGVVAVFIHEALKERKRGGRSVPVPALIAIVAASLLGFFDEAIQGLLDNRVFAPIDIGFNVLAAVMAVVASLALGRVRRRRA